MDPRKPISNVHNSSLESVDRISALPDCLLGVILSLLPTKTAFTTSVLSKRWKFLWRTVHNLDFCLKDVVEEGGEDEEFVGFVNHVLLHHDAGVALNKFRLEWWYFCIESIATSWIKTAITRNVHELSLILFACHGPFDMPISVFSCDSLRSLQMLGGFCLSAATVFCLPRLETLHLNRVTYQSDKALEKIIRGCPMLHDLHIAIDEEDEEVEFTFIIFSTSLRRLELYSFSVRHKYLKLEACSLEHLKLFGYISVNFVPKKLTSLVEANFEIYLDCDDFSKAGTCNSVVDAVSVLDCAKILTLSADVMRALSCATRSLSTDFKRLVKLEASIECCRSSSLIDLIQRSNNLQLLTIRKCLRHPDGGNDHDHLKWTTPVEVPRCLSTTLKEVVLDGYRGYEDQQHDMICYILKHGSVLEGMQVSGRMDEIRKRIESAQEICEFPRKVEFQYSTG